MKVIVPIMYWLFDLLYSSKQPGFSEVSKTTNDVYNLVNAPVVITPYVQRFLSIYRGVGLLDVSVEK